MLRRRQTRRASDDQAQLMIDCTKERVTLVQSAKVRFIQRTRRAQPAKGRSRSPVVDIILHTVAQLQVARGEIDIEHTAGSVLDVEVGIAPAGLFLLQAVAHATRLSIK